jgi:hypothetical protein
MRRDAFELRQENLETAIENLRIQLEFTQSSTQRMAIFDQLDATYDLLRSLSPAPALHGPTGTRHQRRAGTTPTRVIGVMNGLAISAMEPDPNRPISTNGGRGAYRR